MIYLYINGTYKTIENCEINVENPKIIIPPITKIKREVLDKVIKEYNDLVFDTANEDLSITLEDIKNIKV